MNKITKFIMILVVVMVGFGFAKSVLVTGPVETEEVRVKSFNRLDVRSQFDVYLTQGNKEELVIETYKSLRPYIKVEQENNTLKISFDRKVNKIKWGGKDHILDLHITVKDLEKISLSGACDLYMQTNLETKGDLKISASGASDLDMKSIKGNKIKIITSGASDIFNADIFAQKVYINASGASDGDIRIVADIVDLIASGASDFDLVIDVNNLKINAHGASDFNAKGRTKIFTIDVSGSSEMKAYDLVSDTVIIEASGSSNCKVHALKVIDANSSGASSIYFIGKPDKTKFSVSGVSTIKSK
ncbi:MAG: DUF2807 domain-containing protein [Candidatus Marinimicrobia bacterium]|nr:DUF2807 domain-containing protein [Candidatus Neomarinimicrobiota bacterium]